MTTEKHVHLVSGYFRSGKTTYIQNFLAPQYNAGVVVLEQILDDFNKERNGKPVTFASAQSPVALLRHLEKEGVGLQLRKEQMKLWTLDEYVSRMVAALNQHKHLVGENHSAYTSSPRDRKRIVERLRATGKVTSITAHYLDADLKGCFERMVARDAKMNPAAAREANLQEFELMMQGVKPTLVEGYDELFIVTGIPGNYEERKVTI